MTCVLSAVAVFMLMICGTTGVTVAPDVYPPKPMWSSTTRRIELIGSMRISEFVAALLNVAFKAEGSPRCDDTAT